jgi:hypothetical protein
MGTGGVVIQDDVDAFGNREGGGVPFCFGQRRAKNLDLQSSGEASDEEA